MAPRFFGRYEHSLDVKGRIILPVRFRSLFEARAYVSQHQDQCLAMWTPDELDRQASTMEQLQDRSPEDRNMARVWAAGLAEVEVDRQGRVALPQYLRDFARLDGQVLIHGALNRIELWNPADFTTRIAPAVSAFGATPVPQRRAPD